MIRRDWQPGLMHAVIFLGFMSLLLRKLQLIAIGYDEPFVYPGLAGGAVRGVQGRHRARRARRALAYAFWRRFVLRPARLEPNREALLVLSLILAIMITDFAFDGFRFALFAGSDPGIAHERAYAFAGSALADALRRPVAGGARSSATTLSTGCRWSSVFAFLVILPIGEHFHIVTALPTLYFRRGRPGQPRAERRPRAS